MTDVGKAIRSALATARHIAAPLTRADGGRVEHTVLGKVYVNPNAAAVRRISEGGPTGSVRGVTHGRDTYVWDAYDATHEPMMRVLGVPSGDYGVRRHYFHPAEIQEAGYDINKLTGKIPRADGGPVIGGGAQPQSDPASPPVAGSLAPPLQKKPSIAPPVQQPRAFNGSGMYSHAVEEALRLPQVRGNPQQMLASLKGVKKEELDNANPAQAFAGKSHVTREELAHHFRTAMPRIHESEFSDDNDPGDDEDEPQETQYGEYTIPGGKNYRELLLHLPPTPVPPPTPELQAALKRQNDTHEAMRQHAISRWTAAERNSTTTHADPEYQRLQEVAANAHRAYHAAQQAHVAKAKNQDFKSSHWSTPNVLAHLRLSDRQIPTNEPYFRWRNQASRFTSQDFPTREAAEAALKTYPESTQGRVTLEHGDSGRFEDATHLEELQSDWGQNGREKGFRDPSLTPDKVEQQIQAMLANKDATPEDREALRAKLAKQQNAPPTGPYVTSTNGWTDLGLKRALLEAARAGHSRLVWTPGAEQAKRYGMSNHIDELAYLPGAQNLTGYKGGKEAVNEVVPPEKLHEYIGREVAQKLLATAQTPGGIHRLAGQDLDVGGEGHKEFYDRIVPIRLKDILKKLGHEARFEPVTVTHKPKDNTPPGPHNMRTTLHSLHLPPELRDKIKKGLPAFARGGAALTQKPTRAYAAGDGGQPHQPAGQFQPRRREHRAGAERHGADGQGARLQRRGQPESRVPHGGPVQQDPCSTDYIR